MTQLVHRQRLLRKVKFNNGGGATIHFVDFFFNPETQGYIRNADDRTSDALVHDDFKEAMRPFNEHWMIFGEEAPEPKANYPFDGTLKGVDRVTVTSVTLSGGEPDFESDEEPAPIGVHIQGTYRLKCGRVKNYCLPGIKLGSPGEKYKFATHVDQHMQALEREALEYLSGKQNAPAQQAMDFGGIGDGDGGEEASDDIKRIGAGADVQQEQD